MDWQGVSIHLLNFVAPALVLALLLPLAGRFLAGKTGKAWWMQVAIHAAAGILVLGLSLWWWGRDGKMAAYAALVLVATANQCLLSRVWRR